jgi:uncharacterized membrane protein
MNKIISGWLESLKAFTLSNNNFFRFIRENIALILLFSLMTEAFQHYFIFTDRLTAGTTSLNMMAKFGQVMASLLSLVFYQMMIPLRLQDNEVDRKEGFFSFVHRQTMPYFLESMRVLGKCLLIFIAGLIPLIALLVFKHRHDTTPLDPALMNTPADLVIIGLCLFPGMFYYVRYSFVPYIVLTDPEYQKGRIDALKHSFKLMTGVTVPVVLVFVALFRFETYRTKLREEYSLMTHPLVAFLLYIPFELAGIYINILLFYIYRLKQKTFDQPILTEVKNGITI